MFQLVYLLVNSLIYNNLSVFIKRLLTFIMVNLFNFCQNSAPHRVDLHAYWYSELKP